MKYITRDWLVRRHACRTALGPFDREHPKGKALLCDVVKGLQEDKNPDERPLYWLLWIMVQDLRILKAVLALGIDPEFRDEVGYTPLMEAVLQNKPVVVKHLIGLGVDVNAEDFNGESVLRKAVLEQHTAVKNILKKAGAK